jgi:hypothetical protein
MTIEKIHLIGILTRDIPVCSIVPPNILGSHSIGHSKQEEIVYVHVFYSERFPRYSCFSVQYTA